MTEDEQFEADEKARITALHKTAPEAIWLQIDSEAEQFDGWYDQTWCSNQISDTDLMYVRIDLVEGLRQGCPCGFKFVDKPDAAFGVYNKDNDQEAYASLEGKTITLK